MLRALPARVIDVEAATLARASRAAKSSRPPTSLIERRPRAEVGRDVIAIATQAVGLAARDRCAAGRLLRAADLMKPEVVQRNEAVTLVYEVPGITLTVRGKAIEGGAVGDMISVLNVQSKRTSQGMVAGPGRVVIASGAPRLAANIPPAARAPPPLAQRHERNRVASSLRNSRLGPNGQCESHVDESLHRDASSGPRRRWRPRCSAAAPRSTG